ncbi:hypothetical protein [Sediminicola luteus]|uniref:Uncharacterized protein n=1 Tax=Sediminicola luteus TaxID=319238 RepID=A0ABV2TX03_9FLAO
MGHEKGRLLRLKGLAMTVGKRKGRKNCHCERNVVERGNLMNGTQKGQIASAKRPRNDGRDKQIASLRSQ